MNKTIMLEVITANGARHRAYLKAISNDNVKVHLVASVQESKEIRTKITAEKNLARLNAWAEHKQKWASSPWQTYKITLIDRKYPGGVMLTLADISERFNIPIRDIRLKNIPEEVIVNG